MKDENKTKKQLIIELVEMRKKIAELQRSEIDRKLAEEALLKERDRSSRYLDIAEVILVALNSKGEICMINRKGSQILGYEKEELIGKKWFDTCLPISSRKEVENVFQRLVAGDIEPVEYWENPVLTKSGQERIIAWHNSILRDEAGRIDGTLSSGEDITERKRAEEALKESEKRYRLLAENATDVIWVRDMNLRLTYISPSVKKLRGFSVEEAMAQTIDENMTAASAEVSRKALIECLAIESQEKKDLSRPGTIEVEMKRKDGSTVWVEVKMSFIRKKDNQPVGILGISRDITERKRAEEALRESEEQIYHMQRLESVGRLAGGVAHDFNNILQAISGYTELLLEQFPLGDQRRSDLGEIKKSALRAASLTRQLLAYSRKQRLLPETIDINGLVANMDNMLRRIIGEDIALVTALAPELERVKVDPGQFEQVIMNVAVNARQAMHQGGTLTIKTKNVVVDEDYCEAFTYARPGPFVCLTIEDNGVGMDEETVEKIFDPFFTTKGVAEGTGLGLSVVYGIIKQHEGWINVYSEHGQGSTFLIYLPALSDAAKDEAVRKVSSQELKGRGERILMVEDEEAVLKFSARLLSQNGYTVFKAKSSQEAMDIFEKEKGDFHLVFSDVVLTDTTGIELADQLLAREPKLGILLSSGYTDERSQWSVIRERGYGFIQKPYNTANLLQAIKEAIMAK